MAHVLLDVEFYQNELNILFPKKVWVCGLTKLAEKILTLKLEYPYPPCKNDENQYGSTAAGIDDCGIYKKNLKFGDLCFQSINESLKKTISQFDVIIVEGEVVKQFSQQHFPDKQILMLEKINKK